MNRRDLVRRIALGGAVLFVVPNLLTSCSKASTGDTGIPPAGSKINIDLSTPTYAALNTAGGSATVQSIVVANIGGSYFALSNVCTHQGGTVGYDSAAGNFKCPNHNSVFSSAGSVISGPAPTSLKSYPVSLSGTILTITVS
jgi:cytochrome b6-f complex iron-sulfur subunit